MRCIRMIRGKVDEWVEIESYIKIKQPEIYSKLKRYKKKDITEKVTKAASIDGRLKVFKSLMEDMSRLLSTGND